MVEIKIYWSNLQERDSVYAEARKAQIMMLAPAKIICRMRWENLDLVNAVWAIRPSGAGIPLPKPMVDMLTKRQHLSGISPYVFFDQSTGEHVLAETLRFGELIMYEAFLDWFVQEKLETTFVSDEFIHKWADFLVEASDV